MDAKLQPPRDTGNFSTTHRSLSDRIDIPPSNTSASPTLLFEAIYGFCLLSLRDIFWYLTECVAMALNDYTKTLLASLEEASLVPGPASALIPSSFSAGTVLDVAFSTRNIELGTFIRAGECKQAPRVSFAPEAGTDLASPESSYTLILTDPDAPTPDDPRFAFWRHWVLTGLRPSGDSGGESTSAVTEYLGPGPKDEYVGSIHPVAGLDQTNLPAKLEAA